MAVISIITLINHYVKSNVLEYTNVSIDGISSSCTSGTRTIAKFGTDIEQSQIAFSIWRQ
jgi:hypothetical protein